MEEDYVSRTTFSSNFGAEDDKTDPAMLIIERTVLKKAIVSLSMTVISFFL